MAELRDNFGYWGTLTTGDNTANERESAPNKRGSAPNVRATMSPTR
jgi:hypothetical protein